MFQQILQKNGVPHDELTVWRGIAFLSPHEMRGLFVLLAAASSAEIKKMHEWIREKSAAFAQQNWTKFSRLVEDELSALRETARQSRKMENIP